MNFEPGQFIKTRRHKIVGKIVKVFKSHGSTEGCVGFVTFHTDAVVYRPFSDVAHLSNFDTWWFRFFGVLDKLDTKFSNYQIDETFRRIEERMKNLERSCNGNQNRE